MLITPEQRNSLRLKWHEMRGKEGGQAICPALEDLAAVPFQDVLDESDEILHHRFVTPIYHTIHTV